MIEALIDKVSLERLIMLGVFFVLMATFAIYHRDNLSNKFTMSNSIKLLLPVYTVISGGYIGYAWLFEAESISKIIPNSELLLIASLVLVGTAIGELKKLFSKSGQEAGHQVEPLDSSNS